jgi:LPS export ABC transporter protein LptC
MAFRVREAIDRMVNRVTVGVTLLAVICVACERQTTSASPTQRTAADSADQVMHNARMIIASNGVRRGEASGDSILSFEAATRFDIRPMRVRFGTALGRPLAVLTAPGGGVYSITASALETRGQVTIASDTSHRQVTTTALRYDPVRDELASDSAFTATAGARRLEGVGFTADPGLFTIRCLQRCIGSLGP